MVKKKKSESSGLMSSAGLMRYFDADETTIYLDPKTVITIGILAAIIVLGLNIQYGLWP
ncbi:MAG TPA: preprotein translocase subunit Sec61beta [Methanosarcinales archaeon]|nr:preprotein translocase subunit Sec61beta [Methanosarcinales archaeon]